MTNWAICTDISLSLKLEKYVNNRTSISDLPVWIVRGTIDYRDGVYFFQIIIGDHEPMPASVRYGSDEEIKALQAHSPRFSKVIVGNLRQNAGNLDGFTDDEIYNAYENWATSEDFPDETKVREWIEGVSVIKTFDGAIMRITDNVEPPTYPGVIPAPNAQVVILGSTRTLGEITVVDHIDRYFTIDAIIRNEFDRNSLIGRVKSVDYLFNEMQEISDKITKINVGEHVQRIKYRDSYKNKIYIERVDNYWIVTATIRSPRGREYLIETLKDCHV